MKYIVLLSNGTTGELDTETLKGGQSIESLDGEIVTITCIDENGCPFDVEGVLSEVLEEVEPYDRWASYLGMNEE